MAKVVIRKLGRHKVDGQRVWGFADKENEIIEIDPRQRPKQYFDTIIHEAIHVAFPEIKETRVKKATKVIRDVLWDHGYRWVEL